jgi:hypothetical protein
MPEKQAFQIPQQLRELAEKNVEQARVNAGVRRGHGPAKV